MRSKFKLYAVSISMLWVSAAWGNPDGDARPSGQDQSTKKMVIGTLSGLKRPDGFIVEDQRIESMKKTERRETYRRPPPAPFAARRGPLAIYETNVGDADLNIAPVELLAEHIVLRYGDKLAGKHLVVREFSFTLRESIDKPQGLMVIPIGPAALATAIVSSIAGTAIMQGMGGRSMSLIVKINAELDGKRLESSDYGSVIPDAGDERPAKIFKSALEQAFYKYETPLEPVAEPAVREVVHVIDKPVSEKAAEDREADTSPK